MVGDRVGADLSAPPHSSGRDGPANIWTGCWSGIDALPPGLRAVGISVGRPRWLAGRGLLHYAPLAPTRAMLAMDREQYEPRYERILARLDPVEVHDDLMRLADGDEPVLMCYERPPLTADNWCHRQYVARWFRDQLGLLVAEWRPPQQPSLGI